MNALRGTILLAALSTPLSLTGCGGNGKAPEPRTITVVGQGSVRPKPDIVILQLGVASRNASLETAQTNAVKKMQGAITALRGIGVGEDEIQTTDYSVDKYTVKPRRARAQTMYRVFTAVSVRTALVDKAGKIVDAMVHQGVNSIDGPTFGLKDQPKARREAMELAFKNAQQDAERLAKAGGMRLAGIQTLTIGGGYEGYNGLYDQVALARPTPVAAPMAGGPAMPIASGQVRVAATVNVSFRVE
ncbi:MAG TPA: SIMPL domain-containing protein [Armatimonadota bacterium]|jgi:hypothetical protein